MSESFACNLNGIAEQNKKFPKLVVLFSQNGCEPCDYVRNLLPELELKVDGFAEINMTEDKECAKFGKEFGVTGTPTLIEFREGKEFRRFGVTLDVEKDREVLSALGKD